MRASTIHALLCRIMKTIPKLASLAVLVSCLIATSGSSFAQPIQGSISAYAQAIAYNANLVEPPPITSTQTEYWSTHPISPLSVSAFATDSANAGYG